MSEPVETTDTAQVPKCPKCSRAMRPRPDSGIWSTFGCTRDADGRFRGFGRCGDADWVCAEDSCGVGWCHEHAGTSVPAAGKADAPAAAPLATLPAASPSVIACVKCGSADLLGHASMDHVRRYGDCDV